MGLLQDWREYAYGVDINSKVGKAIWDRYFKEEKVVYEQLLADDRPEIRALLENIDVLVDGPFILEQRDLTLAFRGSQNQRLIDIPASLEAGTIILYEAE